MNATFSSRTSYKMPIALWLAVDSRTMTRPEPPSWPCNGCTRSGAARKRCSKRSLRMSIDMVEADSQSEFSAGLKITSRMDIVYVAPLRCSSGLRKGCLPHREHRALRTGDDAIRGPFPQDPRTEGVADTHGDQAGFLFAGHAQQGL